MTVHFHPEFPRDVRRFESQYMRISVGLASRFSGEIDKAVEDIKRAPRRAGHVLRATSALVPELRRRNLHAFPFFVLYGIVQDTVTIASVIPSRSDPLTWLTRFR
jgi:hypothetical protein